VRKTNDKNTHMLYNKCYLSYFYLKLNSYRHHLPELSNLMVAKKQSFLLDQSAPTVSC